MFLKAWGTRFPPSEEGVRGAQPSKEVAFYGIGGQATTITLDLECVVFSDETGRLLVGPAADVVEKAAAEPMMDPHFDATEAMRSIAAPLSAALAEGQDLGEGAVSFWQMARKAVDAATGRWPGEKAQRRELEG